MVGQQTLTNFFIPKPDRKRRSACSELDNNEIKTEQVYPEKKSKGSCEKSDQPSLVHNSSSERHENQDLSGENKDPGLLMVRMEEAERNTSGLISSMGSSWFTALEPQFSKNYFLQLSSFVAQERQKQTIFPPAHQVFSWTRACDISQIKVVILGQDPYHNVNQAHGFAFSVQKGVSPPPSLVNIYNELQNDIEGFTRPSHGDLTGWAKQGVLLLNAVLTVRAHQANSHKDRGWEKFTDSVISYISEHLSNVVFILWGAYAQKKGSQIKKGKHLVLSGPHPSPLSAHRGFFGCKHFSKTNEYLKSHNKDPINWSDL